MYCTPCRALKTVLGLLLLPWAAKGLRHLLESVTGVRVVIDVYIVLFNVVVPIFVLFINAVVVHQVRRKSNDAAAATPWTSALPAAEASDQLGRADRHAADHVSHLRPALYHLLHRLHHHQMAAARQRQSHSPGGVCVARPHLRVQLLRLRHYWQNVSSGTTQTLLCLFFLLLNPS